jgi:GNAT superfamily N-acetyltransferase
MYERVVRYGSMYDGELLATNLPFPLGKGPGDGSVRARGPAGVAVWLPPGLAHTPILRLVRAGLALTPLKFGLSALGRFMAANYVERLRKQLLPQPHWYLWVIGVDPPQQGRGLGSSLVQTMLERADADGLPCYLETHKSRNVTFYEKHGFSVIASGDVPKGGPPYWCMKREARR